MKVSQFDQFSKSLVAAKRRHVLVALGAMGAGGLLGLRLPARAQGQENGERDCPCGWQRVYEHDENGIAVAGDIGALADAVRAGADVKIAYIRPAGASVIEWFRTCFSQATTSDGGGEPVVSCMVTDIPDSDTDLGSGRRFLEPYALEWQAYNTTGRRHQVKFDAQSHGVLEDGFDTLGLAWFIRP